MPAYCLRYFKSDGLLAGQRWESCDDDTEAKSLAVSLSAPAARQLQVWAGDSLILTRPVETLRALRPY